MKFPPHKASMTITHNQHKDYYQDITKYIQEEERENHFNWPNDKERELAIATNEIWEVHWYPKTPIGFHCVVAATFDKALEFACEFSDSET